MIDTRKIVENSFQHEVYEVAFPTVPHVLTSSLWKANWQCPFQAAPAAAPAATMIQEPNTQVGGKSPSIPGAQAAHDMTTWC